VTSSIVFAIYQNPTAYFTPKVTSDDATFNPQDEKHTSQNIIQGLIVALTFCNNQVGFVETTAELL
jgi:hypothetical protein